MLKLAKNLELPDSAITSRICPLGMTGSGKTYTARRLLEEMLAAKGFVIIVDPKGDHFGVRAGKDGDPRKGYSVLIMGGAPGEDGPIRVLILPIRTFDSMRTPEHGGDRREPKALADVDVQAVTARIAESIEQAKANDPVELRKRIADLERQVKAKPYAASTTTTATITQEMFDRNAAAHYAAREREWREHEKLWAQRFDAVSGQYNALAKRVEKAKAALGVDDVLDRHGIEKPPAMGKAAAAPAPVHSPAYKPRENRQTAPRPEPAPAVVGELTLSRKQQEILNALAWWERMGVAEPSNAQLGAVALIDTTGGHYSNVIGPLSTHGLVERLQGACRLTDAGRELAQVEDTGHTMAEYHDHLRERVRRSRNATGKTLEILNAIIDAGGEELTSEQIGALVSMDHTGGHFSNCIGPLGSMSLIERNRGIVRPTSLLFPEALA